MRLILIAAAAALLCACGPTGSSSEEAAAQPASGTADRPAELLGSMPAAQYHEMVEAAARADFIDAFGACAEVQVRPVSFERYRDVADPADPMARALGEAVDLMWRERLDVSGCGVTTTRNVLGAREPGSPVAAAAPSLPGTSRVSHGVMRVIMQGVAGAAAAWTQACPAGQENFRVVDTRVVDAPANARDWTTPWTEEWTLRNCGQLVRVTMAFTPTPDTGGYAYAIRNPVPAGAAR